MCGQATNIWVLVAFRFLQGMGGGALLSVSQTIIFELFPKEKRNVASAIFGVGVFVGPTIGPTLGGYITEFYSWPWIFYINVPIGILVASICSFLLHKPLIEQKAGKVDWTGIFLLAISIGSLQTVLERGQTDDWFSANYIVCLTAMAALGIVLFIWWELRVKDPVVNLRVLQSKSLSIGAVLTFVSGVGIYSSVFLTPVFAQRLLGFTPSQTGLLLLPGAFLAIGGLVISARLLQRGVSPVVMITTGMCLFGLFSWQMSRLSLDASAAGISATLIYRGVGLAIVTVPLSTLAVSSLEPKDIPQGAALNNMMRQLGGSFGIATVNTYLAHRVAQHRSDLLVNINSYNDQFKERLHDYTQHFLERGSSLPEAGARAMAAIDGTVNKQSTLMSYLDGYLLVGGIFILTLPLLLLTIGIKRKGPLVIPSDH
jgi:DHA2 family multidrug resistance protein